MKRILIFISALLLYSSLIFAQEADMKVGELLNTGNWFELERVYPAVAPDVQTPMLKQMAEVMLASILDTGASGANLSDRWFAKNAEVAAALPVGTQNVWGHGGTVQLEIVKVPEYRLTIGTASADFKNLPATVPANGTVSSSRDGRLGMGLLKQFSKVIFNMFYLVQTTSSCGLSSTYDP